MPITEKMICITCPMGCSVELTREGETLLSVDGNTCKRGEDYVRRELTDPRRMAATTVRVKGGVHPLVPVYTASAFPKPRLFELLDALRQLELEAPVAMGQVVLANALDTGIDVVASREMLRNEAQG
jgi:CxxC motif-containing protein